MLRKRKQPSGTGRMIGTTRVSIQHAPKFTPQTSGPQVTLRPSNVPLMPQTTKSTELGTSSAGPSLSARGTMLKPRNVDIQCSLDSNVSDMSVNEMRGRMMCSRVGSANPETTLCPTNSVAEQSLSAHGTILKRRNVDVRCLLGTNVSDKSVNATSTAGPSLSAQGTMLKPRNVDVRCLLGTNVFDKSVNATSTAGPSLSAQGTMLKPRNVDVRCSLDSNVSDMSVNGEGTSDSSLCKKPTRGPAKPIKDWGTTGFQISVRFNGTFHPVEENGNKLITQLGVMVRNPEHVPLTYVSWDAMPDDVLERIWNDVKTNVRDCPEDFKDICFAKCGKMWKDYKARIKQDDFLPRINNSNIYEDRPSRVPASQWKILVDYWLSEEARKVSVRNASARSQRGPPSHTGRTHLQELAHRLAGHDQLTDRMSLYIASHDEDHPEVAAHICEYNRLLDEIPEDERTTEQRDRIFLEVFGPDEHGYCRSLGSGIKPSRISHGADSSSQAAITNAVDKIIEECKKKMEKEHLEYREKLETEYREHREKLDNEYAEHLQKLEEERDEYRLKFKDDCQELLKKHEEDLEAIRNRLASKYYVKKK